MRKSLLVAAAAATIAVVLAGCGAQSTPAATDSGPKTVTPITVGVIPIVDVAPLYLGVDKGFFSDEGLDVTLKLAQGGAAIVPAVVSGEYQFGFSNLTSLLLASSKGVPLKAVAAGDSTTGKVGADFGGVIAPSDSAITSAKDLSGHTVAVNTLNNIGDSTIRKAIEDDGGDPSTVKFVEMGFPDMPAAVANHQVDAAWVVEPFLTISTQQGAKVVSSNFAEVDPKLLIAAYFTSDQYIAQHPDVVKAFVKAMNKALTYADSHPDETRAILDKYSKIDATVKQALVLPKFSTDMSKSSFTTLADLALKYGLVDKKVDVSKLLP